MLQAKRTRHRMTAVAVAILAVGVAIVLVILLEGGASTARRTAGPVAQPAPCRSAQLAVRHEWTGVAMGTIGETAVLTNTSTSRCSLDGYPDLQMVNGSGAHLPTLVTHGGPGTVASMRPSLVSLAPGAHASFYVAFEDGTGFGSASCPTSARVQITPPGDSTPITIPWRLQPYGGSTVTRLRCGEIMVSPVVPGIRRRA